MSSFADDLRAMKACEDAVAWVGKRTLERAWRECEYSDWMLWLLDKTGIDTRRCAGLFALRVWHLVPADAQLAAAWAIDCALRDADFDESCTAAYAASAAAYAADAAAAAAAAYAAAHAAHAARDARDADAASAAEQRDRFAAMVNAKFAAIGENDA